MFSQKTTHNSKIQNAQAKTVTRPGTDACKLPTIEKKRETAIADLALASRGPVTCPSALSKRRWIPGGSFRLGPPRDGPIHGGKRSKAVTSWGWGSGSRGGSGIVHSCSCVVRHAVPYSSNQTSATRGGPTAPWAGPQGCSTATVQQYCTVHTHSPAVVQVRSPRPLWDTFRPPSGFWQGVEEGPRAVPDGTSATTVLVPRLGSRVI